MIQVRNLTKNYGNHLAVDHISFDIENGKVYGFLGPNGAGKSTTMNMMTGCLSATEGSVTIDGFDVWKKPKEAKKHIGYLPEIPPLYIEMTAREYLSFVAEAKGVPFDDALREVKEAMELTDITDKADRPIKNLSKGYRQRIGIAMALIGNPDVIILDEPTVGLDPKQIIEIRSLIRELGKTKTVIISSHILAEINTVCDRVLILSHGKLVANDSPEALEASYNLHPTLELTAKGEEEAVLKLLKETAGVLAIKETFAPSEGQVTVSFEYDKENDPRDTLFYAFSEAKIPFVSLIDRHLTLEDIFMTLTADENYVEEIPEAEEETDYVAQFAMSEEPVKEEENESTEKEDA